MKYNISPFVKWAGGKKQIINNLLEKVPNEYNNYFEPFIGGGALFLTLQPQKAFINDINIQLLNVYEQLKIDSNHLITFINQLDSEVTDKERYYVLRERFNEKIALGEIDVEAAGLMIWLNKHCFNGLYRVNSKGFFNVPYNNRKTGSSIDEENLRSIGKFLTENKITITNLDFEEACKNVQKDDFVYFDSPYIPVSATASFTDYAKEGFKYEDHLRLAKLYKELDKKGAKLMLSNNNVELVYELYQDYNIESISVKRMINSKANKRTGSEVIITNY